MISCLKIKIFTRNNEEILKSDNFFKIFAPFEIKGKVFLFSVQMLDDFIKWSPPTLFGLSPNRTSARHPN